ncbi:MAG: M13 family metallopeptidase [Verrucomicrobiota bacterium]
MQRLGSLALLFLALVSRAADAPRVPRFSVDYLDRSVDPGTNFYQFAVGRWLKENPVPASKSRWGGFDELQERNWRLIREIVESAAGDRTLAPRTPARQVGDFFASAIDTNRLEKLGFRPLQADFRRIRRARDLGEYFTVLADLQQRGVSAGLSLFAGPDAKQSDVYAFYVGQGGLGLPSRDYYLAEGFARERTAYREHVARMLALAGEEPEAAGKQAEAILALETELARASKSQVDLRDALANYHRFARADLGQLGQAIPWDPYLKALEVGGVPALVVRQPDFLRALDRLLRERPLDDWKVYLRWHLIRSHAPYLHAAAESEWFGFYERTLKGTAEPEARWQRASRMVDAGIGEALGALFVERHFPAAARQRMAELIANLRAVFQDRLRGLDWMTEPTRAKALAKFDRFTQKIGHPEKFRDYSGVRIRRQDLVGNVQRANRFDTLRRLRRVGQPVDRTEWSMTPITVNAYFSPTQNEIVFPAGILQPPFFDLELDDPINYGAIGVVIGHEITHGYDDQGRKFDAAGNLGDWWTEADAQEFSGRAQKLVDQFNGYEALPGLKVNGQLSLGENIADLGGCSIAYEALQRALKADPAKRRTIDGFTPEQRFFLSLAQLWRTNWREPALRRQITVGPHSPGQFRAIGPHVNLTEFYQAFDIREGAPMWRPPGKRARIW